MQKEFIKSDRCVCCNRRGTEFLPIDKEHTKTKGSGGSDCGNNCSSMCRRCHGEKGNKGITHMAEKYPRYKNWLLANGWEFDEYKKKWINYDANPYVIKR